MKNGSTTITQRRGNHGDHTSTSTAKPNIHGKKLMCIWDQLGVVYYELLKPNETITEALYGTQLMRLSRALKEKRAYYYSRHDEIILLITSGSPARPHVVAPVKTYLKYSIGKFYPTRRILQTLLLPTNTCSDR